MNPFNTNCKVINENDKVINGSYRGINENNNIIMIGSCREGIRVYMHSLGCIPVN